jgi:hypothetical protein
MRATSIAAMVRAEPKRDSYRGRVYQYLVDAQEKGATDQEMQTALRMSGDTLRPTRGSLMKDGLIYDSGKTRQNEKGNACIVWVISEIEQVGMF